VHAPGRIGYDDELRRHNEVLRRAADVQLHDNVLDVSAAAIKRARELARAERLRNVTFEQANASLHRFRTSDEGIWFDSRAWIVTARRQSSPLP
jgi:hypothetical protein